MRRSRDKSRKQGKRTSVPGTLVTSAGKRRSLAEVERNIKRAQMLVRKYIRRKGSLVDEFIAERREAARHE